MAQHDLKQQVTDLKNALSSIEPELDRETSPEALQDFKTVVDNVRLSVWAALTGAQAENYQSFIGRFRLRRGTDICEQILADLTGGGLADDSPDLLAFEQTLTELGRAIAKVKSGHPPTAQ